MVIFNVFTAFASTVFHMAQRLSLRISALCKHERLRFPSLSLLRRQIGSNDLPNLSYLNLTVEQVQHLLLGISKESTGNPHAKRPYRPDQSVIRL